MERQFDYGKTIRLWKNNSIVEQNSILKKKIDFEIKFPFSTLKFFFTFSDSRSLAAATQLIQDSGNRDLIGKKGMSL